MGSSTWIRFGDATARRSGNDSLAQRLPKRSCALWSRYCSGISCGQTRSEEHTSELQSPVHLSTLSLHDALPIYLCRFHPRRRGGLFSPAAERGKGWARRPGSGLGTRRRDAPGTTPWRSDSRSEAARSGVGTARASRAGRRDRKSTRLNSSHPSISPPFPYTTLFRSICVDFTLGGAAAFFRLPLSEAKDGLVDLDQVWGRDGATLRERLLGAATPEAKLRALESVLLGHLVRADEIGRAHV